MSLFVLEVSFKQLQTTEIAHYQQHHQTRDSINLSTKLIFKIIIVFSGQRRDLQQNLH